MQLFAVYLLKSAIWLSAFTLVWILFLRNERLFNLKRIFLLNQMLGSRVFTLSSSFSQSINKKRFEMMKQLIAPPLRKLRFLAIIPVMALIVYAFAEPAYTHVSVPENSQPETTLQQSTERLVRGRVMGTEGPLDGVSVLVTGTNTGTVTDSDGYYAIAIPGETRTKLTFPAKDSVMNSIAVANRGKTTVTITYAAEGYQRTLVERDFIPPGTAGQDLKVIDITLEKEPDTDAQLPGTDTRDTLGIIPVQESGINGLPGTDTRDTGRTGAPGDAESILYIIDGEIIENFRHYNMAASEIKSLSVLKSREAIDTYGIFYNYNVEGITSVILIETKKAD